MQIPQKSLVFFSSSVTSNSISGKLLCVLSVFENSNFPFDKSGQMLKMILDSGKEKNTMVFGLFGR